MGFNKQERERAKREAWESQQNTKRIAAEEEAYAKKERARSEAMMAPIEELGRKAVGRVSAFDTGKDISQVYPALASMMGQASDQYRLLTRQPGVLGKDPRYNARLARAQKGQFMSNLGRAITDASYAQRGADVQEAGNLLGMGMNAGQTRLGNYQQVLGSQGQIFGQAGNLREQALAQAQASFGNLMSGISAATGVVSGISGVSQARSLSRIADRI